MKAIVERKSLDTILKDMQPITNSGSFLPILSNVSLEIKGNDFHIIASNLETFVMSSIYVDGLEDGKTTINATKFRKLISAITQEHIEISATENHRLSISSDDGLFTLIGIGPEEFPEMPNIATDTYVEGPDITEAFQFVNTVVEKGHHMLDGIHIEPTDNNNTVIVATDGKRLSYAILEGTEISEPLTISADVAKLTLEGRVGLGIHEDALMLHSDRSLVITRGKTISFPEWSAILPQDNNIEVVVDKKKLLHALKLIQVLSNGNPINEGVLLLINNEEIRFEIKAIEVGEGDYKVPVVSSNTDELTVKISVKMLQDIIGSFKEEEQLLLKFKEHNTAVVITSVDNTNILSLIMPMSIH